MARTDMGFWRTRIGVATLWYSGAKSNSRFVGDGDPVGDLVGLASSNFKGEVVSANSRLCRGARDVGNGESGSNDECEAS